MKIKELIYQTPEMTEEKLLEIIDNHSALFRNDFKNKIRQLHKEVSISEGILKEYDLIQDKKSSLTKSQRDQIVGFVGLCMIQMSKGNGE